MRLPRERALVSIIIPVRNDARRLGLAIHSALAQSWPATDVIVVDDGSDDNGATQRVIHSYGRHIRRAWQPNSGIAAALNTGVSIARGRYVCWLGSAELYHREKIEHQLAALRGSPSLAAAFSDVVEIDRVGRSFASRDLTSGFDPRRPWKTVLCDQFIGSSLLMPLESFEQCGGFDESLYAAYDRDLALRLAERFPLVAVPGPLVRHPVDAEPEWWQIAEHDRVWQGLLVRGASAAVQTDGESELAFLQQAHRALAGTAYSEARACVETMLSPQRSQSLAVVWVADGRGQSPAALLAAAERAELPVTEVLCLDAIRSGALAQRLREASSRAGWQYRRVPIGARLPTITSIALNETISANLLFADASTPTVPAELRSRFQELLDHVPQVCLACDDRDRPSFPLPVELRSRFIRRGLLAVRSAARSAGATGPRPETPASNIQPIPAISSGGVATDDELRRIEAELEQSGLFDDEWYRRAYRQTARPELSHVRDYLMQGAAQGRDPNPLFDTAWYLSRYPEAIAQAGNPLLHFIRFGAAADHDPHPLFDTKWYRSQYLGGTPAINPLAHYLSIGIGSGFRCNPIFDRAFYMRIYPDSLTGIGDPHRHYLHVGAPANRLPSAEFDPRYYAAQLTEGERTAYRGRLVEHYLRHGRARGLRTDPRQRPSRNGAGNGIAVPPEGNRPALLIIGLVDDQARAMAELSRKWRDCFNVLLLSPRPDGVLVLSLADGSPGIAAFDCRCQLDELATLLEHWRVARVNVWRPPGVPRLQELLDRLSIPYDLTICDYYLLAPEPHLVDAEARFVGEELAPVEEVMRALSHSEECVASLREWRRQHRWLIDGAGRIIARSLDAARRFQRYYRDLSVTLAPPDAKSGPAAAPRLVPGDERLRVGVLGPVEPHSGYQTLLEAGLIVQRRGLALQFVAIGDSADDDALREAGVELRSENNSLAEAQPPLRLDLLWYPSRWPETFSDRLLAGLNSDLPLAIADIGALPEWTTGRGWCWVRPWQWSAEEWVAFFSDIRERHFVSGRPPESGRPSGYFPSDYSFDDACAEWLPGRPPLPAAFVLPEDAAVRVPASPVGSRSENAA